MDFSIGCRPLTSSHKSRARMVWLAMYGALVVIPGIRAEAQQAQLLVRSAPYVGRAAKVIAEFLGAYEASKGVDRMLGDGAGLRDTLIGLRDQLVAQAKTNSANRQILLRQAAMLEGLQSDLGALVRRAPSDLEAYSIKSRTASAIEELKAVQADHALRIGRLEEGQTALLQMLSAISSAPTVRPIPQDATTRSPQPSTKCAINNTGHYGFANKFERTPVTVYLDIAGRSRSISVQVGQIQYFYDVPAGPHDYRVQFQAMRPLMTFPPGAPLIETTITYAEGQVLVEPCRSPVYDIKNAPPTGGS